MRGSIFLAIALLGASIHATALADAPSFITFWYVPRAVGITFDRLGRLYVVEFSPGRVNVFTPDGSRIAQWGADGQDPGSLTGPTYIAIDANDHLFLTEETIHNYQQSGVQEFTTDGTFIGSIGYYSFSPDSGAFYGPAGIAVDGEGHIYIPDESLHRTQVFSSDRTYLYEWPSLGNSIVLDHSGHAFETEYAGVVRKYTLAGIELAHWGRAGSGPGEFESPQGIGVDDADNVYVTDTYNHRVQVFTNDGAFIMQWGSYGSNPGQFYRPRGIAVGPDGRIYVADTWNGRVQVFAPLVTPTVRPTWGQVKRSYR